MNQSKLFILVLLLLLFMVSCSKVLLIPVTLIISGFFVVKRQYNIALIVLSLLFFMSMIFNNKIETFQQADLGSDGASRRIRYRADNLIKTFTFEKEPTSNAVATQQATEQVTEQATEQVTEQATEQVTEQATKLKPHVMYEDDYNNLLFVFNSLLEKKYMKQNKFAIEEIIDNYRINNIFELSKTVLNKDKNPVYNNFLEKITCRNKGTVDYIQCDNVNYKRLYAFCELIYVFTFNLDTVVELINKYNIMSVCQLSAERAILQDDKSQSSFGYETLGLEYYLNEKSFSRKYYDILEILELDEMLSNDANEAGMALEERLYNYHNSNKKAVKNLNTIMVLFDFYGIFDRYILNMEDDEYNWNLGILKSVDLNLPCWESVEFFKNYDVKGRIVKSINKLTSVDDEFLNRNSDPKNPFDTENNSTNDSSSSKNMGSMRNMLASNNSDDGYIEEEDFFKNNLNTFRKRYKTIYDKNEDEKEQVRNKLDRKLNLKYVRENFNKTLVDIINDTLKIYSRRCDLDCYDDKNPVFSRIVFYAKEMLKILTKDDRMMFVGILLIMLSIIFYFIGASTSN